MNYDPRLLAAACSEPSAMGCYLDEGYLVPPHVALMSSTCGQAIREAAHAPKARGARIIFEMPPRHGKSIMGSHTIPIWVLERWPHFRVLHTSYEFHFSSQWGRKARDAIEQNSHLLTTRVNQSARSISQWETTAGGGMTCSGVGGPLTGRGANVLIVDDPIKNRTEANSDLQRESLWDWFTSTAYTRMEPGGVVIVIMTRWHEDDLVGRLVREQPEVWQRIRFPAIAEEDDSLGRSPGDPLWPARYDVEALASIERTLGSFDWASLYQQRPSPLGGAVFERTYFRYAGADPDHYVLSDGKKVLKSSCRYFQTMDTALKSGEESDPSCCMTFAVTPETDLIVLESDKAKVSMGEQLAWAMRHRKRAEERYPNFTYQAVEDAGGGIALIEAAKQAGYAVKPLKPRSRDKVARAAPASILAENGGLYFLKSMNGLEELEYELLVFPNGRHDDQVDCLTYGVELLGLRSRGMFADSEEILRRSSVRDTSWGLAGLRPQGGGSIFS